MLAKGWPTLRGSKTTDPDGDWDIDAPPVARLREAGAVFLGKTTTPEFGWKGVTDSALSGVTRNPWNTSRTTGGSSGGAVAAAALGMGVLHTGTDAGGSVRIPASFTGVFSIKPTYGRVPAWPASLRYALAYRPNHPYRSRRRRNADGYGASGPPRLDSPSRPSMSII